MLDFISLGRHAPWYVALGKGYLKEEGLNVTILPSKGTADAIRSVVAGIADIGFIDVPSLVASGAAGGAIKIVAVNYQNPDVVKKFVRGALRGWQYALSHPEELAQIQLQHVKALNLEIIVEEINILKRVAVTPDVEESGFGIVSLERMRKTVDFINKNIDVPGEKLTAEQIYRPGYLPAEPVLPN